MPRPSSVFVLRTFVFLLLLVSAIACIAGADNSLVVGSDSVPPGDEALIPVLVASETPINAIDLTIQWDPNVATVIEVMAGPASNGWLIESRLVQPGLLLIAAAGVSPIGGDIGVPEPSLLLSFETSPVPSTSVIVPTSSALFSLSFQSIEHTTISGSILTSSVSATAMSVTELKVRWAQ